MSNLTISDLGTLFDGPHATPTRIESGPYFLNISSLDQGRLDLKQSDHVSEEDFAKWTKRVEPAEGDLLFSYETRLGEAALMPAGVRACLGRRMALIRPNRAVVDPRFLLYYYLGPDFQRTIEQHTIHGATVNRISLSTMGSWPVQLPTLAEQRAIAEVLGALDDKIAANTKLAESSERLSVTLLSGHKSTLPLSALVRHHKKTINPTLVESPRVAHFSLPAFDANRLPDVASPADIKSSKFLVDQPSVLVSKLNPRFPRVWDISEIPSIPALASTEFLVLEPLFSSSTFLWASLLQRSFGNELESKVAGTSGSHQRVRPADLLNTPVLDPRAVPAAIRDRVTSVGVRGSHARGENLRLAEIRDALLPQLMSGKLRVKDAEPLVSAAS